MIHISVIEETYFEMGLAVARGCDPSNVDGVTVGSSRKARSTSWIAGFFTVNFSDSIAAKTVGSNPNMPLIGRGGGKSGCDMILYTELIFLENFESTNMKETQK